MNSVICYWHFDEKFQTTWRLAESFAIDDDGYCLTTPSTGGGGDPEWFKWMFDVNGNDWIPKMSRAVTMWSMDSGVKLLNFHPPEFSSWTARGFFTRLCNMENWSELLQDGHYLYFGTITEAEKYVKFSVQQ
jgi:hypothetical protein